MDKKGPKPKSNTSVQSKWVVVQIWVNRPFVFAWEDQGKTLRRCVEVKDRYKWVELQLKRSVGGDARVVVGVARDRQADSSAVTDDRAKQRLARDSLRALSSRSKKKQTTDFWLLVSDRPPDCQASKRLWVFGRTTGAAQQSDTPKGKNVDIV